MTRATRLPLQIALGASLVLLGLRASCIDRDASSTSGLLEDAGAPIRLAVASVNSARRSPLRNAELVSNVVNALPTRTRLLVLTNDRAAFEVRGGRYPGRVELIDVEAEALTMWPQDPFLVLRDDDGSGRLVTPARFDRAGDRAMAQAVAGALGWPVMQSELLFEGGNVVSDARVAFVGADTIRANAVELGVGEIEIARRFEALLERPVQIIGPSPQPVAHIDLVLTPLGEGRLALADPGRGASIVAELLARAPDTVAAFEAHAESVFFGHASIRALPSVEGDAIRPPPLQGRTPEAIAYSRALAPVFDRLARELAAGGFEIVRVPALLAEPGVSATGPERFLPGYPLLAYQNVLLEHERDVKTVYLPHYGLDVLDRAAKTAWHAAGYRVREIDGLLTSASYGGGLRCGVKVLERAAAGPAR